MFSSLLNKLGAFKGLNLKGIVYGAINNSKTTLNKLWT